MASYNELNALIDAYINRNGVQAITGQILNGVLKAMVEQLGRGYTIMGAATPTTDPGTPDGPECYFASETGTYTDFDGLQVAPGELALLCYTPSDGWTKATIYEGFQEVGATIDGNVGTPSVGVSYADGVLSFDFHNMKGNPGQNGQDGAAAGFGTIGADITGGVGTPGVSVESSGPATAKNLQFHFTNLKGETGVTSVVATVDNTTGTPACTVSLVGQQLTLAFSGLKGAQGNTGSSVDYPFTIVNNLTTDDATQALSAAQGVVLEGEITQLEAKVTDNVNRLDAEIASREETFNATTDDDTFYVTDKNGYVVAKIDSNGLTDVNTESTRHILENIVNSNDEIRSAFSAYDNKAFYICDNEGNIAFSINKNGDINHKTIRSDERSGEFYITDAQGYVALHIDNSGNVNYNGKSDSSIQKKDDGYTPADIVLNIMYGQSLSLGGFIDAGENVSTILQFNSVDNYVMTHFTDDVLASEQSIAEYFGESFIPSKTGINTTPIGFANTMIMRLLNAENGININYKEGAEPNYHFQMLGVNPTYTAGGASWTMCADPDQLYYKRLLKSIEYGKKIAESNNLTFCVGSVCYMQGENSGDNAHSSTTRKEFHDKLWVLFSNLDYDIKRITGQDNDVEYFTYQLASQASLTYTGGHLDIPLAQLDIALETGGGQGYTLASYPAGYLKSGATLIDRKYIHLGAIMNSLDYANGNDHIHCTNNSYATAGAEFGVQIKRAVYDQETPKIIYPKSHKVIQRDTDWLIVLDMDVPVRPLVFDTEHKECQSQRATSANYGFSILNGETEIITGVYLRRGQEICIACSANPTGRNLTYAKDGWEIGGNLRDSQNIPFTINGFNNVIHNWCPTFEITI